MTLLIMLFLCWLAIVSLVSLVAFQPWGMRAHGGFEPRVKRRVIAEPRLDRDPPTWQTHDLACVAPIADLTGWLAQNRDPGLWYAVMRDLNFDLPPSIDAVRWILQQPDCPNAVAVLAIQRINWPEVFGMDDPPEGNAPLLTLLQIITDRDAGTGYRIDNLSDGPGLNRSALICRCAAAAQAAHEAAVTPVLRFPYRTLMAVTHGPLPLTTYLIEDDGVYRWMPEDEAAFVYA